MDMTPSQMQAAIRKARGLFEEINNQRWRPGTEQYRKEIRARSRVACELEELRAIVLALDTWAGDGLRTGQELDQITTAARDYVERFVE